MAMHDPELNKRLLIAETKARVAQTRRWLAFTWHAISCSRDAIWRSRAADSSARTVAYLLVPVRRLPED